MTRRALGIAAALVALAAPAAAVGLGPLYKEGLTDGPQKGFYLTLLNPYAEPADFTASAVGFDDEQPQPRVQIVPDIVRLGGGHDSRILVVASDLAPGETYRFRVCAERAQPPAGVQIHARVCSKLVAHRVGAAGGAADGGIG